MTSFSDSGPLSVPAVSLLLVVSPTGRSRERECGCAEAMRSAARMNDVAEDDAAPPSSS
jgi:hypothetical protein